MANNIAVSVTADVADATAKMAVIRSALSDVGKQAKATAKDIVGQGGWTSASEESKRTALAQAEAINKLTAELAIYKRQSQATATAVNDNTGQMRAGFQNLGFQLQDVAVQFASGQRAGTIFAQQLPQVAGALTQIAQAGGNTAGVLGRFATFMSGPWGVAVGIAAAVMPPLIAKLLETGNAADTAKGKVYGLQQALADLRTKPMEALGKLNSVVLTYEGALRQAEAMPRYTGGGSDAYKKNTYQEKARQAAIDKVLYGTDPEKDPGLIAARDALRVATGTAKTNESLFNISAVAGRLKATKIGADDSGGSGAKGAGRAAASAYREGFDEELRALQKTTDKIEATLFKPLADRSREEFQRRDENAAKFFQERLATVKRANAAELAESRRFEEQKRAIQERTYAPFAQSLARMLTLQRGFMGTLRDLWGNLVGIVEQAVARMITTWLVGLAAQDAAEERSHFKKVFLLAKQAAASAWKAVVGIPIIGPILAPAAAAASFAGVMAFASAEDGWDVPGGGGAGIDGRGGRPAIIHPREMVLPAQIADSVRALPGGLAAAASLRGATASVADINTGALDAPRIGGGNRPGYRRARGGGSPTVHFTIQALDGQSVQRMLMKNGDKVAAAMAEATRQGWRPRPGRR